MRGTLLIVLVAAAAGCGGSAGHTANAPHGTSGKVAPVPVQLVESGEHTTARTVGAAGGVLTATGADGTHFSLSIPAHALVSPVGIRMTPVRSVSGFAAGTQLAFAVDFQPHGLVLDRAAWLTVQPAAGATVQAGLAVDDHDIASLQPIGHGAHGYVLPVAHFSGTGGVNLPGGFGWWGGHMPGGAGAGALQNNAIGDKGPIDLPGVFPPPSTGSGPPPAGLGNDGDSGSGPNTAPTTPDNGPGSDPTLAQDIADYLQQQASAQLNGTDSGDDSARAGLVKRIVNVIDELARECVAGDPSKIVDIIRWEARGQMLGIDDDRAQAARQDQIIAACTRFELVFTGKSYLDATSAIHIGDAITVTVPLEFNGVAHEGEATATVQPAGYDRGGEFLDVFAQGIGMAAGVDVPNNINQNDYVHCTTQPGTIHTSALVTNMYKDAGPAVALTFSTTSQSTVACDGGVGSFQVPPFVTMPDMLRGLGIAEATDSGLVMPKFTKTGGATPYATHTLHGEIAQGPGRFCTDWSFKINFAPGKLPPPAPAGS